MNWEIEQAAYWDSIAVNYGDLYLDYWSECEDKQTQKWLASLIQEDTHSVLDLACGVGLGYDLFLGINEKIDYTGIDISEEMIARCSRRVSRAIDLHVGSMHDLSMFHSETFDCVVSLYTSFSFTNKPLVTLSEIHRVLKPRGKVFISVLNRWGLWRVCSLQLAKEARYKTRGTSMLQTDTPAKTFTRNELIHMFSNAGFSNIGIYGQGLLSGILQKKGAWEINKRLSTLFPNLCHTLNIIASK